MSSFFILLLKIIKIKCSNYFCLSLLYLFQAYCALAESLVQIYLLIIFLPNVYEQKIIVFYSFVFQFVSVTFWLLYAYDRETVYPKIIDSYIPFWQNHGMHTTILPLLLFELFTTRHKFPPVSTSFVLYLGFVLCYAFVYVWLSIFLKRIFSYNRHTTNRI